MTPQDKRIAVGFVSLGMMGTPMVSHLHAAGHPVTLNDLDQAAATQLANTLGG